MAFCAVYAIILGMKKIFLPILICLLLIMLSACGEKEESVSPVDVQNTALPTDADSAEQTAGGETVSYGKNAEATVTGTAACSYAEGDNTKLYISIEYKNSGDCPIIIKSASVTAKAGDVSESAEFTPELNEYMILLPGETGYIARWLDETAIPEGEDIALTASLKAEKSESRGARLTPDRLYIADNYPDVTTLSGRLTCSEGDGCSVNMVFVGFYDQSDKFIGAWYFSKNALFEGGDSKNFVINMSGFPIKNLSEKAASIKGIGFGFEF